MWHVVQDCPDKATEFPSNGRDGHMSMFALVEPMELFVESVLSFECNGDNLRRLSLSPSVQDQIRSGSVTVIPGSLNEETAGMDVAGFGDGSTAFSFTGGVF